MESEPVNHVVDIILSWNAIFSNVEMGLEDLAKEFEAKFDALPAQVRNRRFWGIIAG